LSTALLSDDPGCPAARLAWPGRCRRRHRPPQRCLRGLAVVNSLMRQDCPWACMRTSLEAIRIARVCWWERVPLKVPACPLQTTSDLLVSLGVTNHLQHTNILESRCSLSSRAPVHLQQPRPGRYCVRLKTVHRALFCAGRPHAPAALALSLWQAAAAAAWPRPPLTRLPRAPCGRPRARAA